MEGWVGLNTTTVGEQSAQNRYVQDTAVSVQTVTPDTWGRK